MKKKKCYLIIRRAISQLPTCSVTCLRARRESSLSHDFARNLFPRSLSRECDMKKAFDTKRETAYRKAWRDRALSGDETVKKAGGTIYYRNGQKRTRSASSKHASRCARRWRTLNGISPRRRGVTRGEGGAHHHVRGLKATSSI